MQKNNPTFTGGRLTRARRTTSTTGRRSAEIERSAPAERASARGSDRRRRRPVARGPRLLRSHKHPVPWLQIRTVGCLYESFVCVRALEAGGGCQHTRISLRDLTGRSRRPVGNARPGVRWCHPRSDLRAAQAAGLPPIKWLPWMLTCEAKTLAPTRQKLIPCRACLPRTLRSL